jgi:hypothetical protein
VIDCDGQNFWQPTAQGGGEDLGDGKFCTTEAKCRPANLFHVIRSSLEIGLDRIGGGGMIRLNLLGKHDV